MATSETIRNHAAFIWSVADLHLGPVATELVHGAGEPLRRLLLAG